MMFFFVLFCLAICEKIPGRIFFSTEKTVFYGDYHEKTPYAPSVFLDEKTFPELKSGIKKLVANMEGLFFIIEKDLYFYNFSKKSATKKTIEQESFQSIFPHKNHLYASTTSSDLKKGKFYRFSLDLSSFEEVGNFDLPSNFSLTSHCPDSEGNVYFGLVNEEKSSKILYYDIAKRTLEVKYTANFSCINDLLLSPNKDFLVAGDGFDTSSVWDVNVEDFSVKRKIINANGGKSITQTSESLYFTIFNNEETNCAIGKISLWGSKSCVMTNEGVPSEAVISQVDYLHHHRF